MIREEGGVVTVCVCACGSLLEYRGWRLVVECRIIDCVVQLGLLYSYWLVAGQPTSRISCPLLPAVGIFSNSRLAGGGRVSYWLLFCVMGVRYIIIRC